ncbi:MAG: PAS domain S-box protein [Bacteroidota bacterium]
MDKLDTYTGFDLEYFFTITPDLLCIAGFDGFFKKINPAVSDTLGYTNEELFASPISSFIHPDDEQNTAQKRHDLIKGESLLNFENRYLTKEGSIIWLSWTSVPIISQQLIFAIAKNITYRKRLEEYERISSILEMINDDHQKRFNNENEYVNTGHIPATFSHSKKTTEAPTYADQLWLNTFEEIVRKHTGKKKLNLVSISSDLALSERQLFRRVNQILGITPNKLVRVIRLQLAWEAIASGKYRTIKEISNIAGYNSRSHFSKLFKEVYGFNVSELL